MIAECYQSGRYWQAAALSKKLVTTLQLKVEQESDPEARERYTNEIEQCMERIRPLEQTYDADGYKETGKLLETVLIRYGFSNLDFINVFGNYCSDTVQEIALYEYDFYTHKHMSDLNKLAQVFIDLCINLKHVTLKCKKARPELRMAQLQVLREFREDIENVGLNFDEDVKDEIEARKIVLSTGIVFFFMEGPDAEAAAIAAVSAAGDMTHQPKCKIIEVWSANVPPQH